MYKTSTTPHTHLPHAPHHTLSNYDEEVTSLQQFSSDMMVEACVRCLRVINPDFESPTILPEAMSARYRMCSTLANACQVKSSI